MTRSDYMTAAVRDDGNTDDDYADVVGGRTFARIQAAVASDFTRGVFNGAIGARHCAAVEELFPVLSEAFAKTAGEDFWRVEHKTQIDLSDSLMLMRMELIESIGHCRHNSAHAVIRDVLRLDDDTLHFSVLRAISSTGWAEHQSIVVDYLQTLSYLDVPPESVPHLHDAAQQALVSCSH